MNFIKLLFITLIIISSCKALEAVEAYEVFFQGVEEPATLELLQNASQLIALQNSPPTTDIGLRRRAESDVNNIVKVLHSQALYNARVTLDYDFHQTPYHITIQIDPGPAYPIEELMILPEPQSKGSFPYRTIENQSLGVCIGEPAFTSTIIDAENALEQLMHCSGYPYANVTNREVIADQECKTISIVLFIDSGPKVFFGKTLIEGRHRVKNCYFKKIITWNKGELYCPDQVTRTQSQLELSNLFSSVSIVLPEEPPEEDSEIPLTIEVKESKPRTIGIGINYETYRGPGVGFNWEHRNVSGIGDRFSVKGDIWSDMQYGRLSYLIPDFKIKKQDLIWHADYLHERDVGYHAKSFSVGVTMAREVTCHFDFLYGLMYKHLINTDIHEEKIHQRQKTDNETFDLIKFPTAFKWNYSNSILDPTTGYKAKLRSVPSYSFIGTQIFYSINVFSTSCYIPLDKCQRFVIAAKGTFGSILGPCKTLIPRSELFDAGTDNLLRGYKYKSVSPLDNEYKPTGGRSMMIYSLEYRIRMTQEFGSVLFWDFGNVFANRIPQFDKKILHSVGIGVRYFTPVGPIRLDFAFPLNRRPHVDKSSWQAYLSIGQAF